MMKKDSPQSVINAYRKRQQMMPFMVGGLAVLLVAVGIIILVVSFTGQNKPQFAISLFASATPTPTETATVTPVTPTVTPTETATVTMTVTVTQTSTPSGPFEYTVKDGDTCWDIASKFKVDLGVLQALNNFGTGCPITPSQKILIPTANQTLPTDTPIPTGLAKGTKIQYTIKLGESLDQIASRFNTTKEAIVAATADYNTKNKLPAWTDQNLIYAGQVIIIPVNIATATATRAATSTSATSGTPATATKAAVTPTK